MNSIKNEAGNLLPQAFTFNASNQQVRSVIINGEPYFVAKDICDILQLTDVCKSVERLDEDERLIRKVFVSGQNRDVTMVNESGLYNLIFRSTKPEAKAFRKWVTSELLPTLRKTGEYKIKPQRKSIRYPRRGELMNAEILELLWLIGESLNMGDQKQIALELGVARQTIHRVLSGAQRSSRILGALYRKAQENRAADLLYTSPAAMTHRLLKSGNMEVEDTSLPPLQLNPHRGGTLGNKNACKSNLKK